MLRMTPEEFAARMAKLASTKRTHRMDDSATPEQINAPMVEASEGKQKRETPKAVTQLIRNLKSAGINAPVVELRFHPVRRWRFDLAWPADKLAVEIDGGIWTAGRHTRGAGMEGDNEKINSAILLGWRVLRFSSGQAKSAEAIEIIKTALDVVDM